MLSTIDWDQFYLYVPNRENIINLK
uniref:SLL1b n=1 Tax=Brassica napus TaxID=3708 RepID=Q96346_BRANA|nr:SLL1b [Brassica napus]